MAQASARVPKMAKRCFWLTTSLGSATLLQRQNPNEEDVEYLARIAYFCV